MKNFLISLVIGIIGFGLGWFIGLVWYAGVLPAMFFFFIAYFILARRSFSKLSTLMQDAMNGVQMNQNSQDPKAILQALEQAITSLEAGFELCKEQFLLSGILHGQVGNLHYQAGALHMQLRLQAEAQRNAMKMRQIDGKAKKAFAKAKKSLELANESVWQSKLTRSWQPMAMLSVLRFRDGEKEEAISGMKAVKGPGGSDPLFWAILTWMYNETGQLEDALLAVNEGVEKNTDSAPLKEMAESIQNRKELAVLGFGMNWFTFFPEQLTMKVAVELQNRMSASQGGAANQPMNRAMRRKMKKVK